MAKDQCTPEQKPAPLPAHLRSPCITAEICKCEHTKSAHHDERYESGAGPCTICDCKKFTWKRFVYENVH